LLPNNFHPLPSETDTVRPAAGSSGANSSVFLFLIKSFAVKFIYVVFKNERGFMENRNIEYLKKLNALSRDAATDYQQKAGEIAIRSPGIVAALLECPTGILAGYSFLLR